MFLQNDDDKAGVTCAFMHETKHSVDDIKPGDEVTVKGEIIHGAYYDEGIGMFVNAAVNNCRGTLIPKCPGCVLPKGMCK